DAVAADDQCHRHESGPGGGLAPEEGRRRRETSPGTLCATGARSLSKRGHDLCPSELTNRVVYCEVRRCSLATGKGRKAHDWQDAVGNLIYSTAEQSYREPAYTGCLILPRPGAAPSSTLAPLSRLVRVVLRAGRNQVVGRELAPYRRFPDRHTGGGANGDCDGE